MLKQNKSWLFSVFAFVLLFAGGSVVFMEDSVAQPELVEFSNLTDADVDMILAVKAEMKKRE